MNENIAIRVAGLSKIYPIYNNKNDRMKEALSLTRKKYHTDFHALNNVSFEVRIGQTVGIIGQNGSGKSTLLKILTGVLSPTSGEVFVNGKVSALLELGAGFNPEMTGMENIYLNGTIMGYTKEEMDKRVPQIIDFADIGDFINQPVKVYSSGMFVRLAFAVAINVEPDILIVDEALSVGDMAFQAKCMSKMKQIIRRGATVFFVSHDMNTIKNLCERCYWLEAGNIIYEGPAAEIADMYLKRIRSMMNAINSNSISNSTTPELLSKSEDEYNMPFCYKKSNYFRVDEEFHKRVQNFRQGSGEVKIQGVEVLGSGGETKSEFAFNEQTIIRIYLEFFEKKDVTVGYHIRNNKNIETIGSSSRLEGVGLLSCHPGEKLIVEFMTDLPLLEGEYNLSVVVSQPTSRYSAYFIDYVENSVLFKVAERQPYKLWNSVYVKNRINIYQIQEKQCSICGNKLESYLPLDSYFEMNQRKNGYDVDSVRAELLNRKEYSCPHCGSSDRDRIYALYLEKRLSNMNAGREFTLVDIAPSEPLASHIKKNYNIRYISVDKYMEDVTYNIDMTEMKVFYDEEVDGFICSHVLEHVDNDLKAMKELHRILKRKTGWGILVVPIDLNCQKTIEDITATPEERWKCFGQDDHVRKYNKGDYLDRLTSVGFSVEEIGIEYFGQTDYYKNSIEEQAVIYIVSKKE